MEGKIMHSNEDSTQQTEKAICDKLVSKIEALAVANHQEEIINTLLRRVDSTVSWNESIPAHIATLNNYARNLKRKIRFTAIKNCYDLDFPYIVPEISKESKEKAPTTTQTETSATAQTETSTTAQTETSATAQTEASSTAQTKGSKTPWRRKTNEQVCACFKQKTLHHSYYEPQNYRNYNYAQYFMDHWIPLLIKEKPEFSLVFGSDSAEKINNFRVTEEHVRISKLHSSKNPANAHVKAPEVLNTSPYELCQHTLALYYGAENFTRFSDERKKIWNALEQANFQNIYIIYRYMLTCKDDSSLLSFLLQMLAMEFCGGREHTSPKKHTAFGSPYESIGDLRHQYFLLQEQCFILQELCHWLENEFSISWNG